MEPMLLLSMDAGRTGLNVASMLALFLNPFSLRQGAPVSVIDLAIMSAYSRVGSYVGTYVYT
eukprot:scaffold207368_cov21-Tisochrysis_lutea.AAC.1